MSDLNELARLKDKVERLRAKAEQAKGAADVVRKVLADKWGCESLKDAKALLVKKKTEAQGLQENYDTRLADFNAEWADELAAA